MTGHADRNLLQGEAVIEKPFTPDALAGSLSKLLGGTARRKVVS